MTFRRRLITLLAVLALLAVPAVVVQALCLGSACTKTTAPAKAAIPFCPLPPEVRAEIASGYRQGRSPDVMGVTRVSDLAGMTGPGRTDVSAPWPALARLPDARVPIVFSGSGVTKGAEIPAGTGLDDIAGTIARVLHFQRPYPDVRAGTAVPGVTSGGQPPRLVLEVAWKGVGSEDLQADPKAWPFLRSMTDAGASGLGAVTGSLPLDSAATLTTIGTGGLPSQHGITGTLVLNGHAQLTQAWGKGAPLSVISTLGDELDHAMAEAPMIGMVGTSPSDRGIVGGTWFVPHDRDPVVLAHGDQQVSATERLLSTGFGSDSTPDLLSVVMRDSIPHMDEALRRIVAVADQASNGSLTVVVAGTGSAGAPRAASPDRVVQSAEAAVPGTGQVIDAAVPGGFFLDQKTLADEGLTAQTVVQALSKQTATGGQPLWANVFPSFAVSFGKYC